MTSMSTIAAVLGTVLATVLAGGRGRCRRVGIAITTAAMLVANGCDRGGSTSPVWIGVAASVASVVESIVPADGVSVHAAGSGVLAEQVRLGAPIDLVIVADPSWLDRLAAAGLIVADSRRVVADNHAMIVSHGARPISERTTGHRWATADAATAPLGVVADRGLRSLGWTDEDLGEVLRVEDAAAARRLVEHGEVDAAVIYASDARTLGSEWTRMPFPDPSAVTVRCEAAIVHDSPEARRVLGLLVGPSARSRWVEAGFVVADDALRTDP